MDCRTTRAPAASLDIEALREKYRVERDKRMRRDGGGQYVRPTGGFTDSYALDPHMPVTPRAPVFEEIDVAILGGGFSGLLAGYHLAKAGVANLRHIDHAGDFGGVWYWN